MPLATCIISGVCYEREGGALAANRKIHVLEARKSGTLIALDGYEHGLTNATGEIKAADGTSNFTLPRGSQVKLSAPIVGLSRHGGQWLTIPDSAGPVDLATLIAVSSVPSTGLTVRDNGAALASLIGDVDLVGFTVEHLSPGVARVTNLGGGGGAPTSATYITQTPNASLSAEQALSALATGLLKVTTATGVLSTATAADLPSAIDAAKIADGSVSNTEFQFLNGVTSSIQDQINAQLTQAEADALYSVLAHTHSGVYEPANGNIQNHIASTSNPHSVTKSQIGLANVDNVQQQPISARLTEVATIGSALQQIRVNAGGSALEYFTPSAGGGSWGSITGTLSSQADLQSVLDAKADESITLTAGAGLTGGGDLSASRSFAVGAGTGIAVGTDDVSLDINGLVEETVIAAGDFVAVWDLTVPALRKMTRANFVAGLGGGGAQTPWASTIDADGFDLVDGGNLQLRTGKALRTDVNAADTLLIQARDVDGASYTTFLALTANNTPTCDLSDSVTKSGQYIYRAGGTDVPLTDGGTGASDASGARTNLGLVIGTHVQAWDAELEGLAGLSSNGVVKRTGPGTFTAAALVSGDIPDLSSVYEPIDANITRLGSSIDLSGAEVTGILAAGRFPALTGDVTTSAGVLAATIANGAITDAKVNASGITTRSKLPAELAYEDEQNLFTVKQTVDLGSLGTSYSTGLSIRNDTPATVGTPSQNAPLVLFEQHGWDVDNALDVKWEMNERLHAQVGATHKSQFSWEWRQNGGSWALQQYLTDSGDIGAVGYVGGGLGLFAGTDIATGATLGPSSLTFGSGATTPVISAVATSNPLQVPKQQFERYGIQVQRSFDSNERQFDRRRGPRVWFYWKLIETWQLK